MRDMIKRTIYLTHFEVTQALRIAPNGKLWLAPPEVITKETKGIVAGSELILRTTKQAEMIDTVLRAWASDKPEDVFELWLPLLVRHRYEIDLNLIVPLSSFGW